MISDKVSLMYDTKYLFNKHLNEIVLILNKIPIKIENKIINKKKKLSNK